MSVHAARRCATECRELLEEPDSVRRARRRRCGKRANITGLPRALPLIPERREARHLKANRTTSVITAPAGGNQTSAGVLIEPYAYGLIAETRLNGHSGGSGASAGEAV